MKTPESSPAAAAQAILDKLADMKTPAVIAIDGRCGSGKTTLAECICKETGAGLVHMDDFFLRPEQRTPQRLAEPGGNVDWERVLREVLLPLAERGEASYRPYDCQTQSLKEPIKLARGPLTVVEGSYSCHPGLWDRYAFHVFLDVQPQEQLRRIQLRNGPEALPAFRDKWIPLEERYFAACRVAERCEIRFQLGAE